MFAGHYGVAFLLKKQEPTIPLWQIFLSVQLVDVIAFILVILGVERISYVADPNPFLRTHLEYLPFSHSLFMNVILATAVYVAVRKWKDAGTALILALGVISHWFIDLIVHVGDLPLFFNQHKTGFGLWKLPEVSLALELTLVAAFAVWWLPQARRKAQTLGLALLLILFQCFLYFREEPPALANSMALRAVVVLAAYALFTALAAAVERKGGGGSSQT